VAVDFYGDVWVANRAPLTQPTITKIINHENECIDANGNLAIETSRDVDNDGRISITNPAEFFGEADECIAMTVVVGDQNSFQARALAIDAGKSVQRQPNPGNVWVGMYTEQAFYQINGARPATSSSRTASNRPPVGGRSDTGDGLPGLSADRMSTPASACIARTVTADGHRVFARPAEPSDYGRPRPADGGPLI
jgi:hypothetical protein